MYAIIWTMCYCWSATFATVHNLAIWWHSIAALCSKFVRDKIRKKMVWPWKFSYDVSFVFADNIYQSHYIVFRHANMYTDTSGERNVTTYYFVPNSHDFWFSLWITVNVSIKRTVGSRKMCIIFSHVADAGTKQVYLSCRNSWVRNKNYVW